MGSARAAVVASATVGATLTLDRARIRWRQGVRTGVVVALVVIVGSTWATPEVVVAAALGAAFVGIADTSDPDRNRLAGLALTLLALAAGTLVGTLIADPLILRVLGSSVVAAICGFVGAIGARTALAGVMALVLTTIYAGTPGDLEQARLASAVDARTARHHGRRVSRSGPGSTASGSLDLGHGAGHVACRRIPPGVGG